MPRRAFAISPVVILLALILAAMLVWKVSFQRGLVPSSHPRADAIKRKITWNATSVVIGTTVIAGLVGTGCYFVFRRSAKAANAGVGLSIAVPVTLISIQAYKTYAISPPARSTNAQATPDRTPSAPPANRPVPAPSSSAAPAAQASITPRSTTPGAPATVQPSRSSTTPSPAITFALEKLESNLNEQAAEVVASIEPLLSQIARYPRADKVDLRNRIDEVSAAHERLDQLAQRFRAIDDEARTALESINADNTAHHAIRFSNAIDATQRSFACGSIARAFDQAREEAQFLLDNFGQWKTGRNGKIESKDFSIQSRANSSRFFIDSALRNKDRDLARIRGK